MSGKCREEKYQNRCAPEALQRSNQRGFSHTRRSRGSFKSGRLHNGLLKVLTVGSGDNAYTQARLLNRLCKVIEPRNICVPNDYPPHEWISNTGFVRPHEARRRTSRSCGCIPISHLPCGGSLLLTRSAVARKVLRFTQSDLHCATVANCGAATRGESIPGIFLLNHCAQTIVLGRIGTTGFAALSMAFFPRGGTRLLRASAYRAAGFGKTFWPEDKERGDMWHPDSGGVLDHTRVLCRQGTDPKDCLCVYAWSRSVQSTFLRRSPN